MVYGRLLKGWELQTGHDTSLGFDQETHEWLQQLYRAWSSNVPVSTFSTIRDSLIDQCDQLDTRISTFCSVAKIVFSYRSRTDSDPKWDELLALGGLADRRKNEGATKKKRKRTYNETNRLRNLAFIAALWSPDIVFHYAWNCASQVQMNMLRACATRYPDSVNEFLPRLNTVLFQRHRQGLLYGRSKTLNEAPLQPHRDFDLTTLASAVMEGSTVELWVTSQNGRVAVDAAATVFLRDIRPSHYKIYLLCKDRFGMLAARGEACLPCSPQHHVISTAGVSLLNTVTDDVDDPGGGHIAPTDNQSFGVQLNMDLSLSQFGTFQEMLSAPPDAMQLLELPWHWNDTHRSYGADVDDFTCWPSPSFFTSPALNGLVQPCSSASISEPATPSLSGRSRPSSELSRASPSCESKTEPSISNLHCAALCLGSAPNSTEEAANLEYAIHSRYYDMITSYMDKSSDGAQSSPLTSTNLTHNG